MKGASSPTDALFIHFEVKTKTPKNSAQHLRALFPATAQYRHQRHAARHHCHIRFRNDGEGQYTVALIKGPGVVSLRQTPDARIADEGSGIIARQAHGGETSSTAANEIKEVETVNTFGICVAAEVQQDRSSISKRAADINGIVLGAARRASNFHGGGGGGF